MRTLFLFLLVFALCPALSLEAQAAQDISDADRAAVAAYNEATAAVSQKIREARKDIREKNSELAQVLARTGADYKDSDAVAAHAALTEAHQAMIEAELENILLYKAYNPEWKPEADGRRVTIPSERDEAPADDAPQKEPQVK